MHDFVASDLPLGQVAQPRDGPFVSGLAQLAEQERATIVAGIFERSDDATRPYNTVVVIGSAGEVRGGLTLGLLTCYDLRFPELARALVDRGADTLVVPAAWVRGPLKEDQWTTLLRARATENTCFVLAAAQCGPAYVAASIVIDPSGVVVVARGPGEGLVTARVERSVVDEVRRRNPSLVNRREPRL